MPGEPPFCATSLLHCGQATIAFCLDRMPLQKSDRAANGDGGTWGRGRQRGGLGDGNGAGAQPAAFDKTDYRA